MMRGISLLVLIITVVFVRGTRAQEVRVHISRFPFGTPINGSTNTLDYLILGSVSLVCSAVSSDGSILTVISYQWDTTGCYTNPAHNSGNPTCFPTGQTTQRVNSNNLTAKDSGTITCTAIVGGVDYTSLPLTIRVSGIAMTGVLIGNSNIVSGNLLTDYSYVYETINSLLARCVTGLGPTGSNDNTALGTWYFNGAPLPYGLCEEPIVHLVQSRAASLMNFIGVINLWQCGPFTTTAEGVYTCVMMNSSMMNQTMRLGVYFSGRTAPLIEPPSSTMIVAGGSPLTLSCTSQGSPPDTFTWRKDGGPIVQSTSITTVTHNSTSAVFRAEYSINNVSISDSGTYTCTVTNPIGSDSENITVTVLAPTPTVTVTTSNTQLLSQSLTLECNVTTVRGITSRVDIIWSSDGTELQRMEGVNVSSTTDNSLVYTDTYTIPRLSIADDGREYQCEVVINSSPPVMSNSSVTLDMTVCNRSLCQHGVTNADCSGCVCDSGYTGVYCDSDIDECDTPGGVCQNGGNCTNTDGSFTCNCPVTYGGFTCADQCYACCDNPCTRGGTCFSDNLNNFTCMCVLGWEGPRCQDFVGFTLATLSQWQLDMNNGTITLEVEGVSEINIAHLDCSQITIVNSDTSSPGLTSYQLTGCENEQKLMMTRLQFDLNEADLSVLKTLEDLATSELNSYISINAGNGILGAVNNVELVAIPPDMAVQVTLYLPDITSPVIVSVNNFDLNAGQFTIQFDEPIDVSSLIINGNTGFQSTEQNTDNSMNYTLQFVTFLNRNAHYNITIILSRTDVNNIKANTRLCTSYTNCWLFISDPSQLVHDTAGNTLSNNLTNSSWAVQSFIDDTTGPLLESFSLDLGQRQLIMSFNEPVKVISTVFAGINLLSSPGENTTMSFYQLQPDNLLKMNDLDITVLLSDFDLIELQSRPNFATQLNNTYLCLHSFTAIGDLSHNQNLVLPISADYPIGASSIVLDNEPPELERFDLDLNTNEITLYFNEPVIVEELYFILDISFDYGNDSVEINRTENTSRAAHFLTFYLSSDIDQLKASIANSNYYGYSYDIIFHSPAGLAVDTSSNPSNDVFVDTFNIINDTTPVSLLSYTLDMNIGEITMTFDDAIGFSGFRRGAFQLLNNDSTIFPRYLTILTAPPSYRVFPARMSGFDLNRLRQVRSGAQDMLIAFTESFIQDRLGNPCIPITCGEAPQAAIFIPDIQQPYVEYILLDMDKGFFLLRYSEVVDILTLNISGGFVHFEHLFHFDIFPYDSHDTLYLTISENNPNMLDDLSLLKLQDSTEDVYNEIYLNVYVLDMVGNPLVPFNLNDGNHSIYFTPDMTPPKLEQFVFYLFHGALALKFNEAINVSMINVAAITIINNFVLSQSTANYTLTGGTIVSERADQVNITYTDQDFYAIVSNYYLVSNPFVLLHYCAVLDISGNCIIESMPLKAFVTSYDTSRPSMLSFSLDLSANIFGLYFSEPVRFGSLDPTQITVHNTSSGPGSSYNLTGGAPLHDPYNKSVVFMVLTLYDLSSLKLMQNIASDSDNTYISFTNKTIKDLANNNIFDSAASGRLKVSNFTADTAAPVLSSVELNIQDNQGILSLSFNEPVEIDSLLNISGISIQNEQSDPSLTWTLSSGVVAISIDSVVVEITFDNTDFVEITSIYNNSNGSIFVTIDSNTITDISGNLNSPITSNNALQVNVDLNHPPFTLDYFDLDMNTGLLTLFFSHHVNLSSIMPCQITVQNSQSCPTVLYTLSGYANLEEDNNPTTTVSIYLTRADMNSIKFNLQLAIDGNNTFISTTSSLAVSLLSEKSLSQIPVSNALQVRNYNADVSPPTVERFGFDCNRGILSLHFDEVVYIPQTNINPAAITLHNFSGPSGNHYTLTSGSSTDHGLIYNVVHIFLSMDDHNYLKFLSICKDNESCFLSLSNEFVQDVNSNYNQNISFNFPLQISYYVPDTTRPSIYVNGSYANSGLDLNSGMLWLYLDEPINLNATKLGLFSLITFGLPAALININNSTLYLNNPTHLICLLDSTDLNAIKLETDVCVSPSNCFISIETYDLFGNSILPNGGYPQITNHFVQEFIPDTTSPVLQSFSFDLNRGLFIFTFDEVINIICFNTTMVMLQDEHFPSNVNFSYNPIMRGTISHSTNGIEITWLLDSLDLTLLKSLGQLFVSINASYLSYSNFISDSSGNYILQSNGVGLAAATFIADTTSPTLVSFVELNYADGLMTLLFDEPVTNINFQAFTIDSMVEVQLTNGTYIYLNEQKTYLNIQFGQFDLRNLKQSNLNGTAVYLSFTNNAVRDFSDNFIVPVSRVLPIEFIPDEFIPVTRSAVFLHSVLDMNTGNLTIEFDDIINSSTINPNAITISNGQGSYYTLSADYPVNPFQSDFSVYIPFEVFDLNAIKLNTEIATEQSNSFIMFSEDLAKDFGSNTVTGAATQNPVVVTTYIPDTTGPSLTSFNLDLNEAMLSLSFDEPVLLASYYAPGIIFQDDERQDTAHHQYMLTGGVVVPADNNTGAVVITIALLHLDLSALQSLDNLTNSIHNSYIRILPEAFVDMNGNAVNSNNDSAIHATFITPDVSYPVLLSFDLILNDSLLILRFSEAVNVNFFNVSGIILINEPTITPSTIQLTINHNSSHFTSEYSTNVHIRLMPDDHAFLTNPNIPIAKSNSSVYLFIENATVYDYAGLPLLSSLSAIPVSNYNYIGAGVMCEAFTTTVEGSVIKNCTSGISGVGYVGDTCIVMYYNITELWLCQNNREWTTVSVLELLPDIFQRQLINVLETVSFTCVATGYHLLSLNWSYPISDDRVNIVTINRDDYQFTSILTIDSTLLSDTGVYICTVSTQELTGYVSYNLTVVPLLQESAQSITTLEGQSVSLECLPTSNNFPVQWMFNGNNLHESGKFTFSPINLNHSLSISDPGIDDSGDYNCYLDSFPMLNRTITLEVIEVCQPNYIDGVSWDRHRTGQQARIRCSRFHPSFRPGVYITRMCNDNKEWGDVDYSSCTMRPEADPFVMLEVEAMADTNSSSITAEVLQSIEHLNYGITRTATDVYLISSATVVVVVIDIDNNTLSESIVGDIMMTLMVGNGQVISATAFNPEYQCSCTDVLTRNRLNHICIGPSVAPCTLLSSGSFQCTILSYAGNGIWCGLDSDSDGYPDIQLDCLGDSCEEDECPLTYNTLGNNPDPCSDQQGLGCQQENDVWGIQWQFTMAGVLATQKCPGLAESSALASRYCSEDGVWDVTTNVTQCQNIELIVLRDILSEQSNILSDNTNTTMMDLTTLFDIDEVQSVSEELSILTDTSFAIVPNDINTTNSAIEIIVSIVRTTSRSGVAESVQLNQIVEMTSDIIDNLLDISNNASFEISKEMQLPVAEDLLRNIETFALAIGDILEIGQNTTENRTVTINRDNIVMNAQNVPINPELISTIVFPEDFHTQITIPANAIIYQRSTESLRVPVVSYLASNLQSYLNNQSISNQQSSNNMSELVISSQISQDFISLPENGTVKLNFSLGDRGNIKITAQCVYWDFDLITENNQTRGGWSIEGIIQDGDPSPPAVICNSTHLTSFSVLVSASSEAAETAPGLQIVSYIGCGVSIVCLLLTISAILFLRKTTLKAKHNQIHLNLSVALLLAMITFVGGIETAKDSKEGCIVVTTLLHYFFLAVFCWMLCEGIIILVLFVKVIYHGFFQRTYFFLLLGWGLPVPIVAISAGLSYNNYGIEGDDGKRTVCWISDEDGAIWAFTGPVIVIVMINLFIMVISLVRIYQSRKLHAMMTDTEQKAKLSAAKTLLLSILALLPLLGGTWILGLLFLIDSDSVALAWIFTIVNSLQGATIFFFHVVRNKEVVNGIKEKIARWKKDRLLKSTMKVAQVLGCLLTISTSFHPLKIIVFLQHGNAASVMLTISSSLDLARFASFAYRIDAGDSLIADSDEKVTFADKEYTPTDQLY